MLLTDKRALITGASKGIGRAIALSFADAGAHVICCARDRQALNDLVTEIVASGGQATGLVCDVTNPHARQALVEQISAGGRTLDILVNNVGGGGPNWVASSSAQLLQETFAFNVTPAFALTQLCAPHMQSNAAIINISSAAARYAQPGFTAYGTAKAGLSHLTKLLAQELAPKIRVNGIEPGPVLTEALKHAAPAKMLAQMADNTPLKRLGTPQDIANAALFLASDSSNWMTGKILELDGGAEQTVWPG